ncbi:MAG: hypothetical protein V4714_10045 [Bacteroidota bacterium]
MLAQQLHQCIKEYENYISKSFELFQSTYGITIPPLIAFHQSLIPRKGIIPSEDSEITFWFHGVGCEVCFGDIIVDFDYISKDFVYKGFDIWKLHRFILSNKDKYIDLRDKAVFLETLNLLEKEKIISPSDPSNVHAYDYELLLK